VITEARPDPIGVVHIISGLQIGGAEMMLYRLLQTMDKEVFPSQVVSMTDEGALGPAIRDLGIPLHTLAMKRGLPDPFSLLPAARILKQACPAIVQTWMYHADLFGGLAARLSGGPPVVWGIHHTGLGPAGSHFTTSWTVRLNAALSSRLPRRIVCCSQATRDTHERLGFDNRKMVVIPNGFDLQVFRPEPRAGDALRQELGIPPGAGLVGMIARFHPQKDHRTFLEAAAQLHASRPEVHFVLCGHGVTAENAELAGWIGSAGLGACIHLLGPRRDTQPIYAALDVFCLSSSHGEGFPLVVGEAMACAVPCVVTDVGDSASIVGETGIVVPPRDPEALGQALRRMLAMGSEARRRMGELARRRIETDFRLEDTAGQYEDLYRRLASTGRASAASGGQAAHA